QPWADGRFCCLSWLRRRGDGRPRRRRDHTTEGARAPRLGARRRHAHLPAAPQTRARRRHRRAAGRRRRRGAPRPCRRRRRSGAAARRRRLSRAGATPRPPPLRPAQPAREPLRQPPQRALRVRHLLQRRPRRLRPRGAGGATRGRPLATVAVARAGRAADERRLRGRARVRLADRQAHRWSVRPRSVCHTVGPVTEAFAPIERRKVYEQVSERLGAQLGTTLKAREALPPRGEPGERYGVGRSSVREALRMLESRGLIESRGSGTFVVAAWRNPFQEPLSLVVAGEDVDRAQLFEVRRMIEAEAAALAAARRTIDQLNQMHEATDDMEIELARADRFIAADIRFHLVIAEATGNRLLLRLMQAIRDRLTEM